MREQALAALRVINRAAGQVSANRHADYGRAGEISIGTPPDHRQFVPDLVVGGPDVIKKLDLHYRFEPARRHAHGAPYDVGLRQRRVVNALAPELALQAGGELEDAALALDLLLLQVVFAAAVGNVFAEDDDTLIPAHLVLQTGVDQVRHGLGRAL